MSWITRMLRRSGAVTYEDAARALQALHLMRAYQERAESAEQQGDTRGAVLFCRIADQHRDLARHHGKGLDSDDLKEIYEEG